MNEEHLYANNFQEFLEHFFSIILGDDSKKYDKKSN